MRATTTTIVVVVLALFVVAIDASLTKVNRRHYENPLAEIDRQTALRAGAEALRAAHAKFAAHRFAAQQTSGSEVCTTAQAGRVITDAFTKCATASEIFSLRPASLAEANTAVGAFCNGECGSYLKTIDTQYLPCFPGEAQAFFEYSGFMCQQEGSNYCGAVMMTISATGCQGTSSTSCTGAGCSWDSSRRKCSFRATNTLLDGVCSGCLDKFLAAYPKGGLLGPSARSGVETLKQTICSEVGDQWCYPLVQDIINGEDDFSELNAATMQTLCRTPATMACLRRISQAAIVSSKASAESMFRSCVTQCGSAASCVESQCKQAYRRFAESAAETDHVLASICLRNAAGQYCMQLAQNVSYETQPCVVTAMIGGCNATCDPKVAEFVNGAGCCLGTLQQMMFGTPHVAVQYPAHTVTGTPAPTQAPQTAAPITYPTPLAPAGPVTAGSGEVLVANPVSGGLEQLGRCASLAPTIKTKLAVQCAPPTVTPIGRSLRVRISADKVEADPVFKERVTVSLTRDTAASAGVTMEEIRNAMVTRDTETQFTTASAASTHMRTLATVDGIRFSFQIVATDPEINRLAAAEFDKQASSNTLVLSSTTSVVSNECTACVDATGNLNAGIASAPGPAGSAAAVATFIAVIIAAIVTAL